MANPMYEEMAEMFMKLSKKGDKADEPAAVSLQSIAKNDTSRGETYSSNDVTQIMLGIEKKQSAKADLERSLEAAVIREVDKRMMHNRTSRHKQVPEGDTSDDEHGERREQVADDSYTSVPVKKRVRKMMGDHGKGNARKKATRSSMKQAKNNSVQEESSDSSNDDMDTVDGKQGEQGGTNKRFDLMNGRMDKLFDMMSSLKSQNESHKQAAQESTQQVNPRENNAPPKNPDKTLASATTQIAKYGAKPRVTRWDKGPNDLGKDVKGSGLCDGAPMDIVEDILSAA